MPPRAQKVPKKQQDQGKRYPVALRVGYEMRKALEDAATKSGRGLAAEAEERIGWTFRLSQRSELDMLRITFGPFLGVLLLAGMAAQSAGTNAFMEWVIDAHRALEEGTPIPRGRAALPPLEQPLSGWQAKDMWIIFENAYLQAAEAACQTIKAFCPPGDRQPLSEEEATRIRGHVINIINHVQTNPDLALIRSVLGDLLKRLPAPTPLPEGWYEFAPPGSSSLFRPASSPSTPPDPEQ